MAVAAGSGSWLQAGSELWAAVAVGRLGARRELAVSRYLYGYLLRPIAAHGDATRQWNR
jgi:hypothetical protein